MWVSNSWAEEHMFITSDDILFSKNDITFKGTYTLGVYGYISGAYILSITTNTTGIVHLLKG